MPVLVTNKNNNNKGWNFTIKPNERSKKTG